MLALIQDDQIIQIFYENSWFSLPNGDAVSPSFDGWTNGTYRLEEIQDADSVPEGKQIVSTGTEIVDDHPKYVHVLEDLPVPDRVTSRQFKMQLSIAGYKTSVDSWVSSQSELIQIAYAESGTFVRSEPMMEAGLTALGFTSEQIDNFFLEASKL